MLTFQQFLGFLSAAMLITASPGPDNLMVLGIGMSKGRRKGIAFGLGCAMGCLSHTMLAVAGISALIAASPAAFTALKMSGGLYLLWLGINAWRSAGAVELHAAGSNMMSAQSLFLKGLFANAINPKVALFFFSFLPQFVIPENTEPEWQMAALGVTFTLQAAVLFAVLGYFGGSVGQWFHAHPNAGMLLDRISAAVFVGLGLRLIVSR